MTDTWGHILGDLAREAYYREPAAIIFNADCLEILPRLPKVDLVLTDPPFNHGKDFANDNMNDADYLSWIDNIYKQIYFVMADDSAIISECAKRHLIPILNILSKYYTYEHQIINHHTNDMRRGKMGWSKYSIFLWFGKGKSKKRYCYGDLLKTTIVSNKKEFSHPSPKVIECYKRIIDLFSDKNQTILDTFLGSGTSIIAAKNLGRKCIGIEIKKKYCDIAIKRLRQEVFLY